MSDEVAAGRADVARPEAPEPTVDAALRMPPAGRGSSRGGNVSTPIRLTVVGLVAVIAVAWWQTASEARQRPGMLDGLARAGGGMPFDIRPIRFAAACTAMMSAMMLRPGDLVVYDSTAPYGVADSHGMRQHKFRIPLDRLGLPPRIIQQISATTLCPGHPIAELAAAYFHRLTARPARTFLTRRDLLRGGAAARSIAILGGGSSSEALALRTFAARQRLPHLWWDADSDDGRAMIHSARLTPADLSAIFTPHRVVRRATPGELAHLLGLSYQRDTHDLVDLTVIGSGPAGLGAAVYGASEGLDTVLLDAIGIGGQAAASSRIENYLGFPSGLSGQDLTQRAALQAMKFGAQLSSPCVVVDLDTSGAHLRVTLGDGKSITARTVLIASGVHYRALPLPRWTEFEGAGIYYAATEIEARACGEQPVTVIGGANSAGQAALYLASRGSPVTLAVRGHDPGATMSSYLLGRLTVDPRITIRTTTEVTDLHGATALESITLSDNTSGRSAPQPCYGLFCFIGAEPATSWLRDVDLDADGFIRTDTQLDPDTLGATWAALGRAPLPFETSMPGVFAAGDVRLASVKRVASAVGEGASAVRSIHAAIGVRA